MKTIKLRNIIKTIILRFDFANPLSDEFNGDLFLLKYKEYLENNFKNFQLTNEDDIEELIEIIFRLNDIYELIMHDIIEIIDEINLNYFELIEQIFIMINYEWFLFKKIEIKKNKEDINTINIFDGNIENEDIGSILTDSCNFLLEIISSFKPKKQKNKPVLKEHKYLALIKKLILTANIYINISNSFDYYKYEYGDIKMKGDAIIFKNFPKEYYTRQVICKERHSNLINEFFIYIYNFHKKISSQKTAILPKLKISNNLITTIKYENEGNPANVFPEAVFISFYDYLNEVKLQYFDNVTVFELIKTLYALQSYFTSLNPIKIIELTQDNQNGQSIPIKIKKNELIQYLTKITLQKEELILKILDIISSTIGENSDLWSKPLIKISNCYYFIIPAITEGYLSYLVDKLLEKALENEKHKKYFKKFIYNKLNKPLKNGYKFEVIQREVLIEISNEFENNVIILTKNNLLILEPCIYSFSIHSSENHSNILKIKKASSILNAKKELIKTIINKFTNDENIQIYGILITNHTLFSGIYLNTNHVIDYFLLNNYFNTGKFQEGKIIIDQSKLNRQDMAELKYYINEEEFNTNINDFLFNPAPIFNKFENYYEKEYLIVPKEMQPQIFKDGINLISLKSRILAQVIEVQNYLSQLHYFEEDDITDKKNIDEIILFNLPQIFNLIAFERNRDIREEILDKFKIGNLNSFSYMILNLDKALTQLNNIQIEKVIKKQPIHYNPENIHKILEDILSQNFNEKNPVSFLNFEVKNSLEGDLLKKLINYLIDLLSTFSQKKYLEEDLDTYLLIIHVFISLSKNKKEYKKELYFVILNFVDGLNFNNYYQQARDFSESILAYSLKEEDMPIIGWLCFFKCFIKQKNYLDAVFYGNLFVSVLTNTSKIEDFIIYEVFYNSFLLYRNFGLNKLAEKVYIFLNKLPIDEYEKHKINLSYYNLRLKDEYNNLSILYDDVKKYFHENIDTILKYGEVGVVPWVALIFNLNGSIEDISSIEAYLIKLKSKISPNALENLELKFYPNINKSKQLLEETLIKVFATRNFEDLVFELNELQLLAKNVINISINPIDINSLLLAGLIINDNSLTFETKIATGFSSLFNNDENVKNYIKNYSKNILESVYIKENQVIIWLFQVSKEVFIVTIDSQKKYNLATLDNWDLSKMEEWLSNIHDFYYNKKRDGFFINDQENEYLKTLEDTNFSIINNLPINKEILIYSSLQISKFPHNLLQGEFGDNTESFLQHEDVVQYYLISNSDFISFNSSISNIISIDWFVENGKEIRLKKNDLNIEAWIPTIDEDTSIHIGYNKLRPIIEDQYNGIIYTNVLPEKIITSTINVFLAHGGKGMEGFITLYTRHFDGKAITKNGIAKIFGTGLIAVLFVCSSASISKEIYAQKLNSFTNTILSLGYKAVIAPAWKLYTDISSIWLEAFLKELSLGISVGQAVYKANISVAKNGNDDCYYTPTAWAAMHLYGNPNIYFDNEN
jgi:hypothetical protein